MLLNRRSQLPWSVLFVTVPLWAQVPLRVPEQFAEIGPAIQAASPGDVIVVRWRNGPYQPFVVDRPVTIAGYGGENETPMVGGPGIAVDFRLAAGQRATLSRMDVVATPGAPPASSVVVRGGIVTLEDCRVYGASDPTGAAGVATLDVTDADLAMLFSRIENGSGVGGLRATRSRVAAASTRCQGSGGPGLDGVVLRDSSLHGCELFLAGGEAFFGGSGGAGVRALGNSHVWLVDSTVRGGVGAPAGIGLVNATATPFELLRTTVFGGMDLATSTVAASSQGAVTANAGLLTTWWNEPPYRRGSLQRGQAFAIHLRAPAGTPLLLLASFAPTATAAVLSRQPAMLLGDIAAVFVLVTGPGDFASLFGTVPNLPGLVGTGLWAQGVGPSTPFECSPITGAVVRP